MSEAQVLAQVVLGTRALVDKQRAPLATRLTVFPARPDASIDAAALLRALADAWPAEGAEPLVLNFASEALLLAVLGLPLPPQVVIEVPAFVAADEAHTPLLQACRERGGSLLLKGAGAGALADDILGCFDYVLLDPGGIAPLAAPRPLRIVSAGAQTLSEVDEAFSGGATAVLGWPLQADIYGSGTARPAAPDLQVIVELMKRVDREEPLDRLEAVLKNDASLAFRLVRYINSAAFGLRVEISSFRHAIMLLGYHKLKRWLALLLASAGRGPNVKPVLSTAVLRGLLMEELVRSSGDDQERSEMFICGVFSLLDRIFNQPFAELLKSIPVPERVAQALIENAGPYQPFVELVHAVEGQSLYDIRAAAEGLLLGMSEINRAQLRALAAAAQLE